MYMKIIVILGLSIFISLFTNYNKDKIYFKYGGSFTNKLKTKPTVP